MFPPIDLSLGSGIWQGFLCELLFWRRWRGKSSTGHIMMKGNVTSRLGGDEGDNDDHGDRR